MLGVPTTLGCQRYFQAKKLSVIDHQSGAGVTIGSRGEVSYFSMMMYASAFLWFALGGSCSPDSFSFGIANPPDKLFSRYISTLASTV
jgi:hypothetical protein